eukprot:767168-Hanusia_phi.AAC.1
MDDQLLRNFLYTVCHDCHAATLGHGVTFQKFVASRLPSSLSHHDLVAYRVCHPIMRRVPGRFGMLITDSESPAAPAVPGHGDRRSRLRAAGLRSPTLSTANRLAVLVRRVRQWGGGLLASLEATQRVRRYGTSR